MKIDLGGALPVLQRELREGARRRTNHRLRFWSVIAGTGLLYSMTAASRMQPSGTWLLGGLHKLILGLIVLIAPALTADCIAREKREGTLGLLFLTPLTAGGIAAGKALTQALRTFTLWLAFLPILVIPFLEGGVTWFDALCVMSLEFSAAVLCLAAGLLASSLARDRNQAFILAFFLSFFFLLLFVIPFSLGAAFSLYEEYPGFYDWSLPSVPEVFNYSISIFCGPFGGNLSPAPGSLINIIWILLSTTGPVIAILVFCLVCRIAARRMQHLWRDKPPTIRHEQRLQRYCTPLFRPRFRAKMQRTLDWNPIAWLQQYSWKARISKWGLFLAFLSFIGVEYLFQSSENWSESALPVMLWALAGFYTFAGVNGFLGEKRSGALELILVTPISVNKLIFGRAWGLWKQFLPSAILVGALFVYAQYRDQWRSLLAYRSWLDIIPTVFDDTLMEQISLLICMFLSLPIFATYFALRAKNLIVAALLTWAALWVPFAFVSSCCGFMAEIGPFVARLGLFTFIPISSAWYLWILYFPAYAAFSLLACFMLRHSLSRRIYAF